VLQIKLSLTKSCKIPSKCLIFAEKKEKISEGTASPLFLYDMFKNLVEELLEESLNKRPDLFLIDFEILDGHKIRIVIDGDNGVLVEDCMFISRAIEHNLDREEQDFSLEVSSAGATTPLVHQRQYKKHIGRTLKVKTTNNDKYEAILKVASRKDIVLEWKTREPKPVGKGKVTVQKSATIPYQIIEKAQIKLVF